MTDPDQSPGEGAGLQNPRLDLRRASSFLTSAVKKAISDNLPLQAAALAFITILSLVPLLAAFSFLLESVFDEQRQRLIPILTQVLPYTQAEVVGKIEEFLEEAKRIRGFGFLGFLVTTLATFSFIDVSINKIWDVESQRPIRKRLLSLTLVLFWGPLLIGAAYSTFFFLQNRASLLGSHPLLEAILQTTIGPLVPPAMTFLGLTMLYYLVPYTSVRFRSAVIGSVVATLLLEGLKFGFGYYIEIYQRISIIYGSFGLALFFMMSIQLTWLIVLLGSEVAYCAQHPDLMLSRRLPAAQLEGRWMGLAAVLVTTHGLRRGRPITPHEQLARRLRLSTRDLRQALAPLVDAGLLQEAEGEQEGYLLACDPYRLRIDEILEIYEDVQMEVVEPLSEELTSSLARLRTHMLEALRHSTGEMTVAELLDLEKSEEEKKAEEESCPETTVSLQ